MCPQEGTHFFGDVIEYVYGQQANVDDQRSLRHLHLGEPRLHRRNQRALERKENGTAQQGPDQRLDKWTQDNVETVAGRRDEAQEEERDGVVDSLLQGLLLAHTESRQHVEEVIHRRANVLHRYIVGRLIKYITNDNNNSICHFAEHASSRSWCAFANTNEKTHDAYGKQREKARSTTLTTHQGTITTSTYRDRVAQLHTTPITDTALYHDMLACVVECYSNQLILTNVRACASGK